MSLWLKVLLIRPSSLLRGWAGVLQDGFDTCPYPLLCHNLSCVLVVPWLCSGWRQRHMPPMVGCKRSPRQHLPLCVTLSTHRSVKQASWRFPQRAMIPWSKRTLLFSPLSRQSCVRHYDQWKAGLVSSLHPLPGPWSLLSIASLELWQNSCRTCLSTCLECKTLLSGVYVVVTLQRLLSMWLLTNNPNH